MNFLLFGKNESDQRAPAPDGQPRSITLADRIVPYTIKRRRRRSLSLTIDHRGLRVLGPMRTTLREAEQLIQTHENWVIQKLDEWREERYLQTWSIHHGNPLPYLGESISVDVQTLAARTPLVQLNDGLLTLSTRTPDDVSRNHRALVGWLRQRAAECFEQRVAHYAAQLGVDMPRLSLTQARTRWGSCNTQGHIRLNWRLIHLPIPMIDYVVTHELAHLKEMNHSPRFWAVVETMYPDWRAARQALRGHVGNLPVIEI